MNVERKVPHWKRSYYTRKEKEEKGDTIFPIYRRHHFGRRLPLGIRDWELEAPFEVLAIVGPEGPTHFLDFTLPYWDIAGFWVVNQFAVAAVLRGEPL